MAAHESDITPDEVRERIRVARVAIPEERLALIHGFLRDALKPIRQMDTREARTLEPAPTFDAAAARSPWPPLTSAISASPSSGGDIGARELSPVDVATAHFTRIERSTRPSIATSRSPRDQALADAREAEAAIRGGTAGPLAGIPIAYKDLYATQGVLTTGGSALLADWVPDHDATCVTRLAQAGMVMLGKLITHEFAFGIQFPGHRYLPARNPWNLDHIPGGSSSGSGAALAAGLTVGALGSDTGGSIRGPAAFCGIVGLKPTYGRVSRAGVLTLSWTLDHTGPMARSVEDCAFMLQALAGHDAADPGVEPRARARLCRRASRAASAGCSIGVPRDYFFHDVKPEVTEAFESAMQTLAGARRRRPRGGHPEHLVVARAHGHHADRSVRLPRARPARAPAALRRGAAREAPGGRALHRRGIRAGATAARALCART